MAGGAVKKNMRRSWPCFQSANTVKYRGILVVVTQLKNREADSGLRRFAFEYFYQTSIISSTF
jgi:hypothetical protein